MGDYSIRQIAESTMLVEWPPSISKQTLTEVLAFKAWVETTIKQGIIECWSAYCSVSISYDPVIWNFGDLKNAANKFEVSLMEIPDAKTWYIPVCYDEPLAPDLIHFAHAVNLEKEQVIALHSRVDYQVHFTGFLPGFLYLGGLDERIHLARKPKPSIQVPKGAVAIGGSQTGIYPTASPGGWHIIGQTPIVFFKSADEPPCFINPGDYIRFRKITLTEYQDYQEALAKGKSSSKQIMTNG